MVKQNAGTSEHIVCLTIFLYNPETIEFCDRIRAVWVKRGLFILRHFLHLAVKFRSRGLIEPASFDPNFHLHYADLGDSMSIIQVLNKVKPDEVYNLAAQSHVPSWPVTPVINAVFIFSYIIGFCQYLIIIPPLRIHANAYRR